MTKTMKIKLRTNSKRTIEHTRKRVKAVSLAITECNSPQRPASFFIIFNEIATMDAH